MLLHASLSAVSWPLLAAASFAALGCTAEPEVPQRLVPAPGRVPASRPVCGWEETTDAGVVDLDSSASEVPATTVIALRVAPELAYSEVLAALAPARHALVRVKIAVDGRWLLPLTVPARFMERPEPKDAVVTIVGRRQITRHKAAPRVRIAALRLSQDRVRVYIEHDNPGGSEMAVERLSQFLRSVSPKVMAFTLTATPTTPWRQVQSAAVAAACYDRAPGQEPHEVLFD